VLGGQRVAPETLNRGRAVYTKYCVGCHGETGSGRGGAAVGMTPPPRDFRGGQFKFKSVAQKGDLPTDDDLLRTVREGLAGTHMNPFERLAEADARAVVQFVKTFSPRWRAEGPGEPLPVPPDPWGAGRRGAAIERGRAVYHGVAACWECHPAYVPRAGLGAPERVGVAPTVRPDVAAPRAVETAWGPVTAPDFRSHRFRVGRDPAALYRVIAAGVGGTPMPAWHERLAPDELWALVHYVREVQRTGAAP
jgi:mono/diheme cytochrome c family protein